MWVCVCVCVFVCVYVNVVYESIHIVILRGGLLLSLGPVSVLVCRAVRVSLHTPAEQQLCLQAAGPGPPLCLLPTG